MKNYFFAFAFIISIVSVSFSQETKISLKQVPRAAINAFKAAYPHAKIHRTNKEIKNGVTYYEMESTDGKTHRDVLYTKDGSVAEMEEIISRDQLPQPITDAIAKQYSAGKIKSIEKNIRGNVTRYEVTLQYGKKKTELVFSPDGIVTNNQ